MADATWLALNVVSGGGSFSSSQPIGVTKIAKSVIAPLADQNISVFMLSTYQTDFILVSHSHTGPRTLPAAPRATHQGVGGSWGLKTLISCPQVRERDLPFVTHTLSSEFTILRVVNGETVAAENLGITNGFMKSKMGELGLGVLHRDTSGSSQVLEHRFPPTDHLRGTWQNKAQQSWSDTATKI